MQEDEIHIYTDGACKKNPGPGGWGVVLQYRGYEKTISGNSPLTTNNRMEMTAAIEGLKILKKKNCPVVIYTDSMYLKEGITRWIYSWKRNNWIKKDQSPVKNADLWKVLDRLLQNFSVTWKWVKGHSGQRENEMADRLAVQAISN